MHLFESEKTVPAISIATLRLPHGEGLPLPAYATEGAAGMDLCAAVASEIVLEPGERALIPTGFKMSIPFGYEGQIRARSGMALKRGLGVPNAPGTIDSDYRGEVMALLINWSQVPQTISRGERIAQLVVAPVIRAQVVELDGSETLEDTVRGEGGFGHTGAV